MEGLETFCKTDMMDDRYLKMAQMILKAVPLYQEKQTLSQKTWDSMKHVMSFSAGRKLVIDIIKKAHIDYLKAIQANKIEPERVKYIEKQIEVYNQMMARCFKEIEEEGTYVEMDPIKDKNAGPISSEAELELSEQ